MMVQGDDTLLAVTGLWSDGKTNAVFLGSPTGSTTRFLTSGVVTAQDAYNLDKKLDDATVSSTGAFTGAQTGSVRTFEGLTATANDCLTAGGDYSIAVTNAACAMGIALN